jgi:hypothetical protein
MKFWQNRFRGNVTCQELRRFLMYGREADTMSSKSIRVRLTASFALWLAVALLLSSCDAWTQARGTIRDTSGNPVPDAVVTLKVGSDSRNFRSTEDGSYMTSVSQPPWETEVSITVSKPGYLLYVKKLKGPGIYKELDFVLQPVAAGK